MGKIVPFRLAPSFQCRTVSKADAEEIQAILSETLAACPACTGRGVFPHKHPITGRMDFSPCPCGGTDEDRVELPEFDGVA